MIKFVCRPYSLSVACICYSFFSCSPFRIAFHNLAIFPLISSVLFHMYSVTESNFFVVFIQFNRIFAGKKISFYFLCEITFRSVSTSYTANIRYSVHVWPNVYNQTNQINKQPNNKPDWLSEWVEIARTGKNDTQWIRARKIEYYYYKKTMHLSLWRWQWHERKEKKMGMNERTNRILYYTNT